MVSKLLSKPSEVNSYYFSGRRYDESGLYYFRHRHYDPSLGKFMQAEPKPHLYLTNLYTYAMNNPINLKDPYGLCGGDPGPFPFPDPQSFKLEIFKYQTEIKKSFEIHKFYPASLILPFDLPYVSSYFRNNFEDPFLGTFIKELFYHLLFHWFLEEIVFPALMYEKNIRMAV
jgi:RHS repeat-associated protein